MGQCGSIHEDVESGHPVQRHQQVVPMSRGWVSSIVNFIADLAPNSEVVRGMIAMSAFGIARDMAVELWRFMVTWLAKRFWLTVRLEEKEAELLRIWLREQPEVQCSSDLSVYTRRGAESTERCYKYMFEPTIATATRLRVSVPGGRRRWIWVSQGDKQTATVSFIGSNKKFLETVFEEGRAIRRKKQERDLTVVQVYDYGGDTGLHWLHPQEKVAKQPGRPISSVILPVDPETGLDQAQALLEDARDFLESELWYTQRGIPYRRGYLLHGVPGSGKSSLVMALAHELQLPIYMLSLSSAKMNDDKLNSLLQFGMYDPPSILLLEDIDILHSAVLHRRLATRTADTDSERGDKVKDDDASDTQCSSRSKSRLTLSGLLNALDGPTATTGRLLFMTTNARDRLDPALIRSGRIDYEVEFKGILPDQAKRLFEHFYADLESTSSTSSSSSSSLCEGTNKPRVKKEAESIDITKLAEAFADEVRRLGSATSGRSVTAADVQSHLVKHKKAPARAVKELPAFISSHASASQDDSQPPDDDSDHSQSMVDTACGPDAPIVASSTEETSSVPESDKQSQDDTSKSTAGATEADFKAEEAREGDKAAKMSCSPEWVGSAAERRCSDNSSAEEGKQPQAHGSSASRAESERQGAVPSKTGSALATGQCQLVD
mmetsp:Transcript_22667/g.52915  ORF Transcript_22667/g.52915 Transcript_22667/m.52915 type:complete len:664 (+) Transcript_22667:118-2109(+)